MNYSTGVSLLIHIYIYDLLILTKFYHANFLYELEVNLDIIREGGSPFSHK